MSNLWEPFMKCKAIRILRLVLPSKLQHHCSSISPSTTLTCYNPPDKYILHDNGLYLSNKDTSNKVLKEGYNPGQNIRDKFAKSSKKDFLWEI